MTKRILSISIWTIISFAITTLSTVKFERIVDGNDTFGFPLTFHTKFSGMCIDCPPWSSTDYFNLIIDIILLIPVAIAIDYGITKIKKARTHNKG